MTATDCRPVPLHDTACIHFDEEASAVMHRHLCLLPLVALALSPAQAQAEEVRFYEENGVTFRESVRTVRRPVVQTEWHEREQTVYRPQYRTETRSTLRTYTTPVTQHEWITRMHGRWNPFMQPYFTHHLVPVTRWEQRAEVVDVPVVEREWVPEKRTVSVPVTTQRFTEERVVSRVPVTPLVQVAPAHYMATRPRPAVHEGFGMALEGDPPRQGWRPAESVVR